MLLHTSAELRILIDSGFLFSISNFYTTYIALKFDWWTKCLPLHWHIFLSSVLDVGTQCIIKTIVWNLSLGCHKMLNCNYFFAHKFRDEQKYMWWKKRNTSKIVPVLIVLWAFTLSYHNHSCFSKSPITTKSSHSL